MRKPNFARIYNELYSNYGIKMENQRRKMLFKEICIIGIGIILFILIMHSFKKEDSDSTEIIILATLVFVFLSFILRIVMKIVYNDYAEEYKKNLITNLVECSNPTYKYVPREGMLEREYYESGFDSDWDRYFSEDYISGNLEENIAFKMSQVKTEEKSEETDSEGHTHTYWSETFCGLYGIIKLPVSIPGSLSIKSNSNMRSSKYNMNRIEMESAEFEKLFDVYSMDKMLAMKILTPQTLEKLVGLKNICDKRTIIFIKNNTIYFRISNGNIFEPSPLKNVAGFETLQKYFLIIDAPRAICAALIDSILEEAGDETLTKKHKEFEAEEKNQIDK